LQGNTKNKIQKEIHKEMHREIQKEIQNITIEVEDLRLMSL